MIHDYNNNSVQCSRCYRELDSVKLDNVMFRKCAQPLGSTTVNRGVGKGIENINSMTLHDMSRQLATAFNDMSRQLATAFNDMSRLFMTILQHLCLYAHVPVVERLQNIRMPHDNFHPLLAFADWRQLT